PAQMGIFARHPTLGARRFEIRDPDAGRHAGYAAFAAGPVQHVLRTAKALTRQGIVQFIGRIACQRREQLAFGPAVQIGAGLRSRHIELWRMWKTMPHQTRPRRSGHGTPADTCERVNFGSARIGCGMNSAVGCSSTEPNNSYRARQAGKTSRTEQASVTRRHVSGAGGGQAWNMGCEYRPPR